MFDTILQMIAHNMNIASVPVNGDIMAFGAYSFFRYGTRVARRMLRKIEKIVFIYIAIIIGYKLYQYFC